MAEESKDEAAQDQHFEPGQAQQRADEGAKPSDIGALDGAAAAGSAASAGTRPSGEGGVPTSAPDPTVGPD